MALNQNCKLESFSELGECVFKVVVIGEPRCGKTTFIRAYYDHHIQGHITVQNGVTVYPCEFEGNDVMRRASIYEIPGGPDLVPEQRIQHYQQADAIIFMYAIDDPPSFHALPENWIQEARDIIITRRIPVIIIGNKLDLRDNQQVIERLALENQIPVTFEQGRELRDIVPTVQILRECSANDVNQVVNIFLHIFEILLANED